MENRHDIISRINEKYAAMSKGHKAIATYIMEHYDQAAFMAAAKLGASDVLAIDLDELAVKVAAENTEKNGLSDIVRVAHGDLIEKRDEKADVIVANIIADVICYLCGPVKKHLLEGGTFICSGIIKEREDDVQHALAAAGYTVCNRLAKGEWVCLAAKLA